MRNLQVSVKEAGDHIIFLRKVEPGKRRPQLRHRSGAPGRPAARRDRTRPRGARSCTRGPEHAVTEELHAARPHGPVQIQLFEPVDHNIAERIRELKLDELRPIEALQLLSELQEELKRS